MLYHQATRDYYQESISQGTEELFVTLIVHCTLVPRIAFVLYTVEISKPSFVRLINLVKYYAMLRKTAEGNNYGRITTTNI